MKNLKKIWDFLKFQSYLGSSMPTRDLPSNQNGDQMKKQSNIEINGKSVTKNKPKIGSTMKIL